MKSETAAVIALAVLVSLGQSLAYHDEVEDEPVQVNCERATYQQDNKGACDE